MSDYSVSLIEGDRMAEWDAFVSSNSQGTLYHESVWLNLLRTHMPGQTVRVYGCFAKGQLVGGGTFRADRKLGLSIAGRPWATHYYGIIVRDEDSGAIAIVQAIVDHLMHRYGVIEFVHSPLFKCTEPYRERGFQIGERRTLVFKTAGDEDMWKRLTHDARNASRRAIREGVQVVESEDLQTFRRLYWSTYERQNLTIHFSPDQFEAFCGGLLKAGRGRIWMALDAHGHPCAAVLMGWDGRRAYGLFSGADYQYARNGSGTLVWWEIFMALAPRFTEVDMVGEGTAKASGIKRFKMQFNPTVVPLCEAKCYGTYWDKCRWSTIQRLRAVKKRLWRS